MKGLSSGENHFFKGEHYGNFKCDQHFSGLSKTELKKNTIRNYHYFLTRFKKEYGNFEVSKITSEDIMIFLTKVTDGQKQSTKKLKFSLLRSFFNFIKDSFDSTLPNPCDTPLLKKTFRTAKGKSWTILDRDVVDEIIFRTDNSRNRLLIELMARGGMRVGEVLKLKTHNVHGRKLVLSDPKSGNQTEIVFIPKKVADRLREYIASVKIGDEDSCFIMEIKSNSKKPSWMNWEKTIQASPMWSGIKTETLSQAFNHFFVHCYNSADFIPVVAVLRIVWTSSVGIYFIPISTQKPTKGCRIKPYLINLIQICFKN